MLSDSGDDAHFVSQSEGAVVPTEGETKATARKFLKVGILGVSNAGKSKLANSLVGSKVSSIAKGDPSAFAGVFRLLRTSRQTTYPIGNCV